MVDAVSHEPVISATVSVDGGYVGDTDDTGHLQVPGRCPGTLSVTAERGDYQPGQAAVAVTTDERTLELALRPLSVEVIEMEDKAPPPEDMRAAVTLSGEQLERTRGKAFSEALAAVPGVAQLRSASGLAKPIVRGQYGRRLLLLVDGVRHRAQEWGLDHAPEVDPFVAGELTVVRGASGVRHGPDAIGGAVLVSPPPLLERPGLAAELHLVGLSNGKGGNLATRVQGATARWPGLAWQLEGTYRRLAAPSTPDYPLDNTGTSEWSLGGATGYHRRDVTYSASYRHYQAALGVCSCFKVESSEDFFAQLARDRPLGAELYAADFELERPYQAVAHDLALARGRWTGGRGALTATLAFQHDHRREYDVVRDATTGPQFRFRLFSLDGDVAFDHRPLHVDDHHHLRGSVGAVVSGQLHRYSGLQLVPDFEAAGAGVYALERLVGHDTELELGVRYDVLARSASLERRDFLRLVRSGQLADDACGDDGGDPVACASRFHTVSASAGVLHRPSDAWSLKLDLSTASRPPSTDEQYLNGTAPTFPVLALGKPDLGPETTWSTSATASYGGPRVAAEVSAYASYISDYIDFAPAIDASGQPIFDVLIRGTFPRFVTRAVDAGFWGGDGGLTARPWSWLDVEAQASLVRARNLSDDRYLVFVPPDRGRLSVTAHGLDVGPVRHGRLSLSLEHTRRQDRFELAADLAPPPAAYTLLGAEVGGTVALDGQPLAISLQGSNLTNARYRDYTSLLRYFADQPGWQLMLRVTTRLSALAPR